MISLQLVRVRYKQQGAGEFKNAHKGTFREQTLSKSLWPCNLFVKQTVVEENSSSTLPANSLEEAALFNTCFVKPPDFPWPPAYEWKMENVTGKATAGAVLR